MFIPGICASKRFKKYFDYINNNNNMTNEQNSGAEPVKNESQNPAVVSALKLPMSPLSELFKLSWEVYTKNIKRLIGVMLVPFAGVIGLIIVLSLYAGISFFSQSISEPMMMVSRFVLTLLGLVVVIAFIYISIIAQAGLYIMIRDRAENLTIKESFLRAKKIAWKYFSLGVIVSLFVFLWCLLFVIPGIYMMVAYCVATWVFICEGISGTAAIKRSKELVKGYWWAVASRLVLVYLVVYAVVIILGQVLENISRIFSVVAVQAISFAFAPFFFVYIYFIYLDLVRVKKNAN